jgi:hypothetical protein
MPGSPCIAGGAPGLDYNGTKLTLPRASFEGKAPDLGFAETTAR